MNSFNKLDSTIVHLRNRLVDTFSTLSDRIDTAIIGKFDLDPEIFLGKIDIKMKTRLRALNSTSKTIVGQHFMDKPMAKFQARSLDQSVAAVGQRDEDVFIETLKSRLSDMADKKHQDGNRDITVRWLSASTARAYLAEVLMRGGNTIDSQLMLYRLLDLPNQITNPVQIVRNEALKKLCCSNSLDLFDSSIKEYILQDN